MTYKNTYQVAALSCPDCAMHVVEKLEKFDYIDEVHIDYDKKEITLIGEKLFTEDQVNQVIEAILAQNHCVEHTYSHLHDIVTEEFNFEDIDCPNCAAKVERALNKEEEIIEAKVNFLNKKIITKHLNNVEIYDIVSKIVSKVENGAKIHKSKEDECHSHSCGCHSHHEKKSNKLLKNIVMIIGLVIFVTTSILSIFIDKGLWYMRTLFIISYLLIGYDIIMDSINGIIHGDVFNEDLLMIIASIGALAINEPIEGIMVILLFKIGEYFQDRATEKSKNSIKSLMKLKKDTVTLVDGKTISIKEVNVGDVISVKVGERIPLDGVIKKGSTDVDMKALTGESRPVYLDEGAEILSGSINLSKVIEVEITKEDSESTISKVMKLVEEATNQKSKTEQFITRFARFYTPIVLILVVIIGLVQGLGFKMPYTEVLNNVFSILVISCPCALVISIPLGYFAGIGRASSEGILVKGGNYLDKLAEAESFVFDKTGTITKGNFKVVEVCPAKNRTKEEVLELIAVAEQYSIHPIAQSIKDAFGKEVKSNDEYQIEEISGLGLKVTSNDKVILVGNKTLLENNNVVYTASDSIGTILYLSVNGEYYGNVCIRDEIKESSASLITELNKKYNTVVLTGDTSDVANMVANEVGIKVVESQLLPKQKYERLKEMINNSKKSVVYVGDGINDTPALKLADVGIAMGGIGSDSAKECADIVIANDDLNKISDALKISKFTRVIVIQNIIFALLIKVIAMIVGITGVLGSYGMIVAVFADVGVCLLAILNTMRILKMKLKNKR